MGTGIGRRPPPCVKQLAWCALRRYLRRHGTVSCLDPEFGFACLRGLFHCVQEGRRAAALPRSAGRRVQPSARTRLQGRIRMPLRAQGSMRRNGRRRGMLPDPIRVHEGLQPDLWLRRAHLRQSVRGSFAWRVAATGRPMSERCHARHTSRPGGELRFRRSAGLMPHGSLLPVYRSPVLR